MTGIVERLRNISRGDHERGCQGREYVCSCDYDETSWKTAEEAASEIDRLRRELEEARKALEPFADIAPCVEYTDLRDGNVVHRQRVVDGKQHVGWKELTKDHFRAASAAICTKEAGR